MLNEKSYDTKQRTQEIASEQRGKGPSVQCLLCSISSHDNYLLFPTDSFSLKTILNIAGLLNIT